MVVGAFIKMKPLVGRDLFLGTVKIRNCWLTALVTSECEYQCADSSQYEHCHYAAAPRNYLLRGHHVSH